jgi:methylated-DNA-[protein]-cysteine S-methyltransferase
MTATRYDIVMDAPPGRFGIRLLDRWVVGVDYLTRLTPLRAAASPLAWQVARSLRCWLRDAAMPLDLPVLPHGTEFQQRVWAALQCIPQGEVRTYGELARQLGSGARAVGNACRRNPVAIIVPCHRVVAAGGVGGYGGRTGGALLERKLWLLRHEGALPADLKTA